MPRGINIYDEARLQGRLLTPRLLAQRLCSKLFFWWSADFLTLDTNSLVEGAEDLTGQGRNGAQGTATARLTYFPSDRMFGGRPAYGMTANAAALSFLGDSATRTVFQYFVSCYYKDGVDNSFDQNSYVISGAGSFGSFRLQGTSATAGWTALITNRTFYNTGDPFPTKNGFAASQTVLPLPASVIQTRAALGRSQATRVGGGDTNNQAWIGGFRHVVACNQVLADFESALMEGVIAWDDGTQSRLIGTHPFANRPPLIGD
jgi:hypothetical protein